MNKDNLIDKISDEYNIKRGKTESLDHWKVRVIYSALGRMAVSALWDDYDGDIASITHMKNRISDVFDSYQKIYTELGGVLPKDAKKIAEDIYDIFSHTGIVYHTPDHVAISKKTEDVINNIMLTRGYELSSRQEVSGLGTYMKSDNDTQPYRNIFHLDMTHLRDRWQLWTADVVWNEFKAESEVEYLRLDPPFTDGYWVNKPDMTGRIALMRTGFKGSRLYYLYRTDQNKRILASQLPEWLVENYNYRSMANACLYYEGTLPPTLFRYDGDIVYLSFGYLPPPAELYFWKLYSWPTSMVELQNDFNRICTRCVFDNIVDLMQMQGYEFREEN